MYAIDFYYDGHFAHEYGLMIADIGGESGEVSGGEVEYKTSTSPYRDTLHYYGGQFNNPIEWKFTVVKRVCSNTPQNITGASFEPFTHEEERSIANWLLAPKKGYRVLGFPDRPDEPDSITIFYAAIFQMTPNQIGGKTYGFDLTATTNCGYGWGNQQVFTQRISPVNPVILNIQGDLDTYIYPKTTLTNTSDSGTTIISNNSDVEQCLANGKETKIYCIEDLIILDSNTEIITGIRSPNDFNYYFPRLVNGENIITTNMEFDIKIEYKVPRRVIF